MFPEEIFEREGIRYEAKIYFKCPPHNIFRREGESLERRYIRPNNFKENKEKVEFSFSSSVFVPESKHWKRGRGLYMSVRCLGVKEFILKMVLKCKTKA